MYSLRRTLAVRFCLTMFVALTLIAVWAFLSQDRHAPYLIVSTVLLGTVATAFGASWLSRSALLPVAEIAEQAQGIQGGSPGQRITVHADVEELASLVGVLNGMLTRLDAAFEAQRRIIADVGHDLRTPLTAMRGEIEVALRGERPPDTYRSTLRSVLEELDHLGSISEAMILLARVEAGDLKPRRAPADLGELTSAALHRVAPRAWGRTLEFSQSGDLDATLTVDSGMVGVVLDHLLDNAVRHTPAGTRIEASVHADAGGATIAVRDTGPGIPDDILPYLFERFYRGDPARSRTAGAGLGLTVARAIVDAHTGTITAANLPGRGFQITVTLPRPPGL